MTEPRTKAGRELLADLAYTRDNYLDPILAIEREAAEQAMARPRAEAGRDEALTECIWCGAPLINEGGVWTDKVYGSGDYCPEGENIGCDGTSPHKLADETRTKIGQFQSCPHGLLPRNCYICRSVSDGAENDALEAAR